MGTLASDETEVKIAQAHRAMNARNADDPNVFETPDGPKPKELWMAERLEYWVRKVDPEASTALLLASRCQHLARWTVPRSDYDQGRIGYLKWRKDLARMHADAATRILRDVGFDEAIVQATREINLKQNLKTNPDSQSMEDALCLCFLEQEFTAFAEKYDDDKVIDIVEKTWRKMSARGHELALQLPLAGRAKRLVARALGA